MVGRAQLIMTSRQTIATFAIWSLAPVWPTSMDTGIIMILMIMMTQHWCLFLWLGGECFSSTNHVLIIWCFGECFLSKHERHSHFDEKYFSCYDILQFNGSPLPLINASNHLGVTAKNLTPPSACNMTRSRNLETVTNIEIIPWKYTVTKTFLTLCTYHNMLEMHCI